MEVIGGITILTGILTRITAILFIIEMIGATIIILPKGFVHGYDLALLSLSISASLILTGPGKASIEWDILKREIFPNGKQIVMRNKKALEETLI